MIFVSRKKYIFDINTEIQLISMILTLNNNTYDAIYVLPLRKKVILQCNSIFWGLLAYI